VHVRAASALLTLLYAAALAVAVTDLGARAVPAAVVLAGLLLRWELRRHRPATGSAGAPVIVPPVAGGAAERPALP
jgi:hypothetical protein